MRKALRFFLILLVACLCPVAAVQADFIGPFDVTFDDSGSQTWDATMKADVTAAIAVWDNTITDMPGEYVRVRMVWEDRSGTALATSSNAIVGDYTTAWTRTEYIWREGQTYSDATYDATIIVDSTLGTHPDTTPLSWNYGSDAPGFYEYDFRSVMAHEYGHCVGWISTYELGSSPDDTFWASGISAWDSNMEDGSGNVPAAGSMGSPGNFDETGDVYFTGANAKAANGGQDVALYAPGSYSSGSSLTHLDESTFASYLMSPSIANGQSVRSLSAIEIGMLQDMGWSVVPEPGTIILCLLNAIGLFVYRRRARAHKAA